MTAYTTNDPYIELEIGAGGSDGVNNYNPTFQSGQIASAGPEGLTGNDNFIVGLAIPNPTGAAAPCLLLGSGGGSGTPVTACIIQDEAFDDVTPGNNLIVTAGETQPAGTAAGGNLTLIGGASYGGAGGTTTIQGGTSANANGGITVVTGGNATGGGNPGDLFLIAGQEGAQGANVHLIMSELNGIAGVVRIRVNSTILIDFYHDGSLYLYNGGGFGTAGQTLHSGGPGAPVYWA
jgi:hypothetical protein